jgi:hypothetical protein
MKHLFILFAFILSVSATAQTDDYTVDTKQGAAYANKSYTFTLGPDTIDASSDPDTLIIDFDQSFYGLMNVYATVKTDSLVIDGATILSGTFELKQSQCSTCPFVRIDNTNDDLPHLFNRPVSTSTGGILQDTRIRLYYFGDDGRSSVTTRLTLKPL